MLFTEHAVDRFLERAGRGLSRDEARARLEAAPTTRTYVSTWNGLGEYYLLDGVDLVAVVAIDSDPPLCMTVTKVHANHLHELRVAAHRPARILGGAA